MGQKIQQTDFTTEDYQAFNLQLLDDLSNLEQQCQHNNFGSPKRSYGAEVEIYIIDKTYHPNPINTALNQAANLDHLTLELNQYNLEYNFEPQQHNDAPFSALEQEWTQAHQQIEQVANHFDSSIITIGILPTLDKKHLGAGVITPEPRYLALNKALRESNRTSPFSIELYGLDRVNLDLENVSAEGANTSFQFHYRCPYDEVLSLYNAAQLTASIVLAVSGNSPFFLGQRLWQETRIGLFKQSVDTRQHSEKRHHLPQRVHFGFGWLRGSIFEIFAQNVALFPPLIPECIPKTASTEKVKFHALKLHQSCIWPWIRPIFDSSDDSHIRLEFRAFPSGPTAVDMFANAAFCIGLAQGIRPQINSYLNCFPFYMAHNNFYRAAQEGLKAKLFWPNSISTPLKNNYQTPGLEQKTAKDLVLELLPTANKGLESIGISHQERQKYLSIIEQRTLRNQTGAQWQLKQYDYHQNHTNNQKALCKMVKDYHAFSKINLPVHEWPLINTKKLSG